MSMEQKNASRIRRLWLEVSRQAARYEREKASLASARAAAVREEWGVGVGDTVREHADPEKGRTDELLRVTAIRDVAMGVRPTLMGRLWGTDGTLYRGEWPIDWPWTVVPAPDGTKEDEG